MRRLAHVYDLAAGLFVLYVITKAATKPPAIAEYQRGYFAAISDVLRERQRLGR